jgi:signal transduction histidine kinase
VLWSRSAGLWKTIYAHWFGASLLYSSSSYVANWALERHTYYSGSLYDLPLIASMAWMTLPGLLAVGMPEEEAKPAGSLPRGVWVARLGMLAVFSLPVFAWFSAFGNSIPPSVRTFRLVLTLIAMTLMGGLVFLKQHFLDIEFIRLLRASQHSVEELQLLQNQLVQSEKLASLGQLLGGAAHELNNPLTAILGYSELLAASELGPEERTLAVKIAQQARRIRNLVTSLLSFSKQVPSAKTSLDVNIVVETALKLCRPQIEAARVRYSTTMAAALPPVKGDSNQLLQVFSHILTNAADAMSEHGGSIAVSTRAADNLVIVQFADTGPGVREPGRVFDPFYTTRPVGQGTGLGLSVCSGIVQEHGGKISCRNGDSGGAIFEVQLPALGKTAAAHAAR